MDYYPVDSREDNTKVKGNIIVTSPTKDLFITDENLWLKGFQQYIYNNILPKSISKNDPYYEEIRKKMVSQDAMKVFIKAVTHESFKPNVIDNYETLEDLGDSSANTAFTSRIIKKFPNIEPGAYSDMKNFYLAKIKQSQLSKELRLPEWMRMSVPHDYHTMEDGLEAIHGALYIVGNRILGGMNGQVLNSNFVHNIYNFDDISVEMLTDPVLQLKNIVEILHWFPSTSKQFDMSTIEKVTDNRKSSNYDMNNSYIWNFGIVMPKEGVNFLTKFKIGIYSKPMSQVERDDSTILASQMANSLKTAKKNAYSEAIKTLDKDYGININNVKEFQKKYLKEATDNVVEVEKLIVEENTEYNIDEFKKFILNDILPLSIVGDGDEYDIIRNKMISTEPMEIFLKAFTHKSYDQDIINNYETLEKLGETSSKTSFIDKIIQKYPSISPGTLSNMTYYYLSKDTKSKLSKQLKLYKWIRSNIEISDDINEKVLSALSGALFIAGDIILGEGYGQSLNYNFVSSIYDFDQITINNMMTNPISKLKDIMEILHWFPQSEKQIDMSKIERIKENPDKKHKIQFDILIPMEGKDFIRNNKIGIFGGKSRPLLASQWGNTKKEAKDKAYKQAIQLLDKEYGINLKNVDQFIKKVRLNKLTKKEKNKLAMDGYDDIDYLYNKKGMDTYVHMIGIKKNGLSDILTAIKSRSNVKKDILIKKINDIYSSYGILYPGTVIDIDNE